jgi:hypothetical protein
MGLDMYLSIRKEEYVSKYTKSKNLRLELPKFIKELGPKLPEVDAISRNTDYRVGYWRKANEIHNWFLEKCGPRDHDGDVIDDCRDIYIETEALEKLLEDCKQVLNDHSLAPTILPTQSGFFFGSTEYDEYYFEDLEDTIKILEPVIEFMHNVEASKNTSGIYYSVIYHASW